MDYGITPWGERFYDAIEYFDESGRLGRGKRYANTGRVYRLEIDGINVTARVKGNYRSAYSVGIRFKPFSSAEKTKILDIIKSDPMILADILNRKLPIDLDEILMDEDIELMPSAWSDMRRTCTCPDWGDPCKHMAAVYFMLISEIDKNPFLIFSTRGLDLIKELNIPQEIVDVEYPLPLVVWEEENEMPSGEPEMIKLGKYSGFIISMLDSWPPFTNIDYRMALEEFYKKSAKAFPKSIRPYGGRHQSDIEQIFSWSDIQFKGAEHLTNSKFIVKNQIFKQDSKSYEFFKDIDYKKTANGMEIYMFEMANIFLSFTSAEGTVSYKFLFYLFRVFYLLLESSGFVPAVLPLKKQYYIIYKPLLAVPEISRQINELARFAPDMVQFRKEKLAPVPAVVFILSSLLTDYVSGLGFMHKAMKNNPPQISEAFFRNEAIDTKSFSGKEIPASVANWLAVFEIVSSNYRYSVMIDKDEYEDYYIAIKVSDGEENLFLSEAVEQWNSMEILKFLSLLSSHLPETHLLISQDHAITSRKRLEEFILATVKILSNLGVQIILPKELRNLLSPRPIISVSSAKKFKTYLSLDTMLDYQWMIAIGDHVVSPEEFAKMVGEGTQLIQFNEQFVKISPEEANRIFNDLKRHSKLNTFDIIKANLQDDLYTDKKTKSLIDNMFKAKEYPVPETLNAKLREYQLRGFQWTVSNLSNGFGAILADDMGLGKTIQTIAVLLHLKQEKMLKKKAIVIAPTTLLSNWEKELNKFAPSLTYYTYHGPGRQLQKDKEIMITSYQIAMRDQQILSKEKFECLIIDEAQNIKNPTTKTTKAIKSYKVKYKIALTGTPVENNLSELWSIFDYSLPRYLYTLKQFRDKYAKDIEIRQDMDKIKELRTITAPFLLRRLKTDKSIISDLPDKIVIDEYTTLTKQQAALYQSMVNEAMLAIADEDGITRRGLILKLLTTLKQICNHPANFDKTSPAKPELSGKTELLITLLKTILEKKEKVLIFTQYTEMGDLLMDIISRTLHTVPLYIKGSINRKKREIAVDLFQNTKQHNIFILSLKAAGTGLNLTAASHVIHYDLWYNPAVENQATDRAFRIGQDKNVFVHRFITRNSFEEKIDQMIKDKTELTNLSVSTGEKWLTEMNTDELRQVFTRDDN